MALPNLHPGELIGRRYAIVRELARGERAATYLATGAHGRQAVLRILDPELPELLVRVEQLRQVSERARRLPPEMVASFFVGSDAVQRAPFIVTPFAASPSLAQLVMRDRIGPPEIVSLAAHLARAVDALHELELAHRGLSPTNVFLGPPPEYSVQLVDPGLPAVLRHRDAAAPLAWLAPEQIHDPDAGIPASDVFVSALLVFHALTGRSLLRSIERSPTDVRALYDEVATRPRASEVAAELGVELPATIDEVFRRALARDPGARHPKAQDFAGELADALGVPMPIFKALTPSDPQVPAESIPPVADGSLAGTSTPSSPPPNEMDAVHEAATRPDLVEREEASSDQSHEAPSIEPRPTPNLISLVTKAAPPVAASGPNLPSTPDPREAFGSRLRLERLPYDDPSLVAPPSKLADVMRIVRRRKWLIGGAGVVLVGVALAVIARQRSRSDAPTSAIATTEEPASSVPSKDVDDAGLAEIAAPDVPAPPPESPKPASTAPESTLRRGEGELVVVCEPACDAIAIDGKLTKHGSPFVLRGGTHAIGVSRPRYSGAWKKVDVPAGKRTSVTFHLVPKPAKPPR